MDMSGSMKGLRMAIAKHTVTTILDTLGENDFVNIIAVTAASGSAFTLCSRLLWENILFLYRKSPCFQPKMLPATKGHLEHTEDS